MPESILSSPSLFVTAIPSIPYWPMPLQTRAFVLEGKHRQSFEEMFRAMGGNYKKELFAPYQKVKGYVVYYDFKPPVSD